MDHTTRRSFLRQTVAFSALTALHPLPLFAAPDSQAHHILMIGDWGKEDDSKQDGFKNQRNVAQAMQRYARTNNLNADALFLLGDNWYGDLPGGADSTRFKTQFEDLYPAQIFPGPAYAVMGNHDYQHLPPGVNKVEAELAYARRGQSRWTQPALWYTFNLPNMKVIALDSNVPREKKEGSDFFLTPAQVDEQQQWLTTELAKPRTAPFLVVMAHHPIYSNGTHGDQQHLIRAWDPLLRKAGAHLYLAGHDHDLQHLEFEGHPTSFVCSGAGGANLYDLKIDDTHRGPYAGKIHGFTHLESTPQALTIRHIDSKGRTLHAFTKAKDGTATLLGRA